MTSPSSYSEIGFTIATAIADAMSRAFDAFGLDQPGIGPEPFTGVGIPIADACEGMAWARVGAVFPTDGSSQPYASARPTWDIPAWCFPIDVGVLWCHQNLEPDGSFIDPAQEVEYAQRDGLYRAATLTAIAEGWRPAAPDPLAQIVMGQRLDVWTPIGPDGGYSGGMTQVYVVTNALALCS